MNSLILQGKASFNIIPEFLGVLFSFVLFIILSLGLNWQTDEEYLKIETNSI